MTCAQNKLKKEQGNVQASQRMDGKIFLMASLQRLGERMARASLKTNMIPYERIGRCGISCFIKQTLDKIMTRALLLPAMIDGRRKQQ